jgi:hypothetical protein
LSILRRACSPGGSKIMDGKAGLFEVFDDIREGIKNSIQAVAEESRDKRDPVAVCDISLRQGCARTWFTREAQDQIFAGRRVRRKLSANGGSIKVAEVFDAGVAEGSENDRRHGFLYGRQRFRSAAEEKQSGNGDQCPNCRYGNSRPVNPSQRWPYFPERFPTLGKLLKIQKTECSTAI